MGLRKLNIPKRPASIHLRQAYAAVGQNQLMNMYSDLLTPYGIIPAQILLTRSDLTGGNPTQRKRGADPSADHGDSAHHQRK